MARKKDDGRNASDFAGRVLDLFVAAQKGKPSPEEDRDARRVAFGLACIANAVRRSATAVPAVEYGVNEALAIIDAITSGREHPIWEYLDGIRSFKHMPQHAPKDGIERERKHMLIGAVFAYKACANCSLPKAARSVADACQLADFRFDPNLIVKSWIRNSATDKDAQKSIRAWADHVTQMARNIPCPEPVPKTARLLEASRRLIWRGWSVPFGLGDA